MKERIKQVLHEEYFHTWVRENFWDNPKQVTINMKNGVEIKGELSLRAYDGYTTTDVDGQFVFKSVTKDGQPYNIGVEGQTAWSAYEKSIKIRLGKMIPKWFEEHDTKYKGTPFKRKGWSYKTDITIITDDVVDFNEYVGNNRGMLSKVVRNLTVDTIWGKFTVIDTQQIEDTIVITFKQEELPGKIPYYSKSILFDLDKAVRKRTQTYLNKEEIDFEYAIQGTFRYNR